MAIWEQFDLGLKAAHRKYFFFIRLYIYEAFLSLFEKKNEGKKIYQQQKNYVKKIKDKDYNVTRPLHTTTGLCESLSESFSGRNLESDRLTQCQMGIMIDSTITDFLESPIFHYYPLEAFVRILHLSPFSDAPQGKWTKWSTSCVCVHCVRPFLLFHLPPPCAVHSTYLPPSLSSPPSLAPPRDLHPAYLPA